MTALTATVPIYLTSGDTLFALMTSKTTWDYSWIFEMYYRKIIEGLHKGWSGLVISATSPHLSPASTSASAVPAVSTLITSTSTVLTPAAPTISTPATFATAYTAAASTANSLDFSDLNASLVINLIDFDVEEPESASTGKDKGKSKITKKSAAFKKSVGRSKKNSSVIIAIQLVNLAGADWKHLVADILDH
ncbi:hypothetical protein BDY19DRAFT_995705 [Irpex rosettiformis]|uniref:Uncharacterized protein n=1 Tax=Irpex rosettiformis TaxID=378272 RepID=A0ACB8TXM2_9APHY|nr:hypothetical protein BDY19DRAFT_995705 [Irpex rosettiformis]